VLSGNIVAIAFEALEEFNGLHLVHEHTKTLNDFS